MKPTIFIASALESVNVAEAVHARLQHAAECTPWTEDVFKPSVSTFASLEAQIAASDFGDFVFTPDDQRRMRDADGRTVRDNVLYEMGMSTGALGIARSFFIVPDDKSVQIATDLLGFTPLRYEAGRRDGNWNAAVGPACSAVAARGAEIEHFR